MSVITRSRARAEKQTNGASNAPNLTPDSDMNSSPPHDKMGAKKESDVQQCGLDARDRRSVLLLMFLYVLQGIPLGLAGSVPYIMVSRKATYQMQATFSFVFWPFSLKLFWAPIVDAIYSHRIGRRKTWLVPVQYLIGGILFLLSHTVNDWLGEVPKAADNATPGGPLTEQMHIAKLTAAFFVLNFMAATQDIAVDGWALTMLSRENVGWASTCNSVGQTLGYFIAYVFLLALESAEFCNTWLRSQPQTYGIITFEGFLFFWSIVFVVTTTLIMVFKSESSYTPTEEEESEDVPVYGSQGENGENKIELGLLDTYRTLFRIIRLKPVQQFVLTIFIVKFGFSAADNVTGLKLIEQGVSKDRLAVLGVVLVPIQTILPLLLSRIATGPRPLSAYMTASLPRTLMGIVFALVVAWTPVFRLADGSYPASYYAMILVVYALHQMFAYTMFVTVMAFHAKISDPVVGGTYMTLLNTMANLAGTLPGTVLLYFVDPLTKRTCAGGTANGLSCMAAGLKPCTEGGGVCNTDRDGYYLETTLCVTVGIIAYFLRRRKVQKLEELPMSAWSVHTNTRQTKSAKACC